MRFLPNLLALLFCAMNAFAESPIPLWTGPVPDALGDDDKVVPTITPFFPEPGTATGAGLIICPGGAYAHLAPHEGKGYAEFFAKRGVTCFVLAYRVGAGRHHPAMLHDAARAMRTVRSRAAEWKIDPKRIGIVGSSAGGHLASTLLTHFDAGDAKAVDPVERESSRPDLGILCYAVISMGENTHGGSRTNLLGNDPSPELIQSLSNELQVTAQTPPCFIFHTWEDGAVKVENSLQFAVALRKAGVPFDLHIYEKGGHGMGLGKNHPWPADCIFWLQAHEFVAPTVANPTVAK